MALRNGLSGETGAVHTLDPIESGKEDPMYWLYGGIGILVLFFCFGIRIVRPTGRGLVERLGKYHHLAQPGFNWIIPVIDRLFLINITEMMIDAEPQEIITNDNLNARVDAQVYFKVKSDEESVKDSQYKVYDYRYQIVNLARTTLRNIIGTMTLKSANSERGKINSELHRTLRDETAEWGLDIVRTELKEIDPPSDVQETMNKVVKAENDRLPRLILRQLRKRWQTAHGGRRSRKLKESDRRTSLQRKAKHRRSSSSMKLLKSILLATLSCCASWRRWNDPLPAMPRSSFLPIPSWST